MITFINHTRNTRTYHAENMAEALNFAFKHLTTWPDSWMQNLPSGGYIVTLCHETGILQHGEPVSKVQTVHKSKS